MKSFLVGMAGIFLFFQFNFVGNAFAHDDPTEVEILTCEQFKHTNDEHIDFLLMSLSEAFRSLGMSLVASLSEEDNVFVMRYLHCVSRSENMVLFVRKILRACDNELDYAESFVRIGQSLINFCADVHSE